MKRKTLIVSIIAIIISLFSISYTFAANNTINNMANGVRNVVGGAENVVEGAGNAVGRAVQGGMSTVGNDTKNVENATGNTVGAITSNNNDGYTATRTTTRMADTTNAAGGVSTATYTWIIIGITAVAIVVLLWSYFAQSRKNNMYIDSDDK